MKTLKERALDVATNLLLSDLDDENCLTAVELLREIANAPEPEPVADGHVYVHVSGLTGSGKSAVAGEIEIAMRAIGLDVEWVNSESEKRLTHADYIPALELYKPKVRIFEVNIQRVAPTPAEAPADAARDAELLDWLEQEAKESRTGVSIVYRNQADDEGGIKRGYRLMRYHQIFSAHSNLRAAIEAAMSEKGGA